MLNSKFQRFFTFGVEPLLVCSPNLEILSGMKKIFGYIFLVLSGLLALAELATLDSLLRDIGRFLAIFSGSLDAYEAGEAVGGIIAQIAIILIIILLWKYGRKWTTKATEEHESKN